MELHTATNPEFNAGVMTIFANLERMDTELAAHNLTMQKSDLLRQVAGLIRDGRIQLTNNNDAGASLVLDHVLEVA